MSAPAADGIDKALDQYEAICAKCISLRNRSLKGEAIPAGNVKDLLTELAALRKTLQQGAGAMTEEQRARFERIRYTYLDATSAGNSVAAFVPKGNVGLPKITCPPEALPPFVWKPDPPKSRRPYFGIAPTIGIPVNKSISGRDLSAGGIIMAIDHKSGFGAYLKGGSTLYYKSVAGTCFKDGTLSGGGYFYSSGKTDYSAFSVTGGAIYRCHRIVGVWAGIGYARENIYWESADGKWYGVKDASRGGVCPEAGLLLTLGDSGYGKLIFLAGGRFPLAKKVSIDVGLGWMF